MQEIISSLREAADGSLDGASDGVVAAMFFVGLLLVIASLIALVVSVWLAVSYVKYNRRQNSLGETGRDIARRVLDRNGLENIKVSANGSILFGNSYSHYFKKVRLRRLTWKKKSVSSLAMAVQKSSLAVLDKNGDADMKARVKMTPVIYFGPLAFIPLVIIGVLLDILVVKSTSGVCTITCICIASLIYVASFVMSVLVLKTEKKAQALALDIMRSEALATEEEIGMCRSLFRLYNIEYINNMVIALLELIYRVLQIVAYMQGNGSSSGGK